MRHTRVLKEVDDERVRQDDKWGEQSHPLDTWLTVLAEEVGELARRNRIEVGRSDRRAVIISFAHTTPALLAGAIAGASIAFALSIGGLL